MDTVITLYLINHVLLDILALASLTNITNSIVNPAGIQSTYYFCSDSEAYNSN